MAGRSVNVDLRIKAQDEASKALESVGKALKDLAGAGALAGSGSNGIAKFVADLSKNVDALSAVFNKLETSYSRLGNTEAQQRTQLAALNKSIDDRRQRITELAKAESDLQRIQGSFKVVSPQRQRTFIGPVPPRITEVNRNLGSEQATLEKELRSLDGLIGKIAETRQATQGIRDTQAQVANAIGSTTAEFLRQAEALDTLTAAEKRAEQAARSRVRTTRTADAIAVNTGLNNGPVAESFRPNRQLDLEVAFTPVFAAEDAKAIRDAAQAFDAFEAKAKEGASALAQVQKYARDVAEALDPTAKVTRLVAEEQERLAAAVKAGALSQDTANTALQRYKANLDGTAAATERQSAEYRELDAYVQELRRDFDRAGYAQAFLERETAKLDRARKTLNTTTGKAILDEREYVKALESVRRKAEQLGEQSNPQLFGLNPYQTQNLLFQFNDIATQLASGTSLTQTLSQQGGQILQLFPRVGNSIVNAMSIGKGAISGVVVLLGALVLGIKSAADQAERARGFGGLFAGIATEGSSTVAQVNEVARAIDRYGLSAEEAIAITRKLVREGFDATQIEMFGKTAKDMADVLGIEVGAAVDLLTGAYTGNLESLRRLMDETDAFTPAQRTLIESMYSSGDAAGAFDKAFGILSANMNEGARLARGPWTDAFRNLGNAWDDLVKQLGNTWWAKAALDGLNAVASAMEWLSGKTDEARKAEEARQGAFSNGGYAVDPLASAVSPYSTPQVAGGKTDREDVGTATQQANAAKLTKEAERQAILAKAVTSEKVIQQKLDVIAAQERERLGNSVTKQVQDTLVEARIARERVDLEKQLATYRKQQADEAARMAREQGTMQAQAKSLLRNVEGFRSRAYWDVNAFRAGYGSDTVTRADGRIERVNANTTVTREDAERDLARRIEEFTNVVKQQIGAERFGQFAPAQQAALVSVAYNYGELPKRILGAVREGTNQEIATAVRGLRNDNGGVNAKRRDREAAILGADNLAVTQGAQQVQEDAAQKQREFNETLDEKLRREERSIVNQRELVGLQGAELRAAIERQQVAEALAQATDDLRKKTGDESATLSPDQVSRITVSVRARLQLDEPAKVAADLQKQVDDLQSRKSILQADLTQRQQSGDTGGVRDVQRQIEDLDARIAQAAQTYLDFLNTPGNADALGVYGVELDNMISKMEQLSQRTAEWRLNIGGATITATEFANAFTNTAVSAIDQFAQAIASGKNAFSSLWDAFRQFAADFLLQIARMIQQQIIFNLVSGLLKGLAGGLGGGFGTAGSINSSALSSLRGTVLHEGGVVGVGGSFRTVSPAMFANANRYHSGGIAGLKPGEVPSILMKGEEVLTRDDPRHIMNGGGGGTGDVKIVNAFDYGDVISKAMETRAGQKAILNFVRENPRAFRNAAGG